MTTLGFLVRMEARPGKEQDVVEFLRGAQSLVEAEPATVTWFSFRLGPASFAIFDAFDDEDARQAHLHGRVREGLDARGDELFSQPPTITPVDVLADKLPH